MPENNVDRVTPGLMPVRRIWNEIWQGKVVEARALLTEAREQLSQEDAAYLDEMINLLEIRETQKPDVLEDARPLVIRSGSKSEKHEIPPPPPPPPPAPRKNPRELSTHPLTWAFAHELQKVRFEEKALLDEILAHLALGTDSGISDALTAFGRVTDPSLRRRIIGDISSTHFSAYRGDKWLRQKRKELTGKFLRTHLRLQESER